MKKLIEKYKSLPLGVKAALWYTFCNIAQKAINVVVIPIYTRLLSPAEYGTYSVFLSWLEIFEIIATFRLFYGTYTVGLVKYEEDRERYTSSLEKLSAFITTVFLVLYLIFQGPVNNITGMDTTITLLMFLMLYAIPVVGFWKTLQRVDNLYRGIVVLVLFLSLMTPVCGILGILLIKASAEMVIISRIGVEIAAASVIFILYRKYFTKKTEPDYCRYALTMNVPLIPFYLSMMLLNHSDRIVIQHLVGNAEAGIYSVAYSAAMIMLLFNNAFDQSLQPWLFKRLKAGTYKEIAKVNTVSIGIVAALNLSLIALAPEAIMILAPEEYCEAIWIIPPLAASVFVMFFYQRFINVEFFYNESKATSVASVGAAALNLILNFALIPKFGYLAAGYTTLFSYLTFWVSHYFFYKRICRNNGCPKNIIDMKGTLLISAVFAVFTVILAFGYDHGIIRYGFIGIVFLVCLVKRRTLMAAARRMLKNQ